jgi:valyl-tRNA synthetase
MNDIELIVPLPAEMREQEIVRLQKALEKGRPSLEKTKAQFDKLSSSGKAPEEVIEKLRLSLEQQGRDLVLLEHRLETLLQA